MKIKGYYMCSYYRFRNGRLFWSYDTWVRDWREAVATPCDKSAGHNLSTPHLLVIQREDDVVCFHNERNRWELHS